MLLKNAMIREGKTLVKKDILIENGIIKKIENNIEGIGIDLAEKYVCPSFTDLHVHFREPGFTNKETIKTGSLSAAKGGYTTVFLMPNLNPCPDSVENLKVEEEIIKKDAIIECIPYASVSIGEKGEKVSDIEGLKEHTRFFSDDGVGVNNIEVLDKALEKIKKYDLFIASHAEDLVDGKLPQGEYVAVRREIEHAKKYNSRYHFCHMSTRESFEAIKKAQDEGYNITCEVSPHHLFLTEDMIKGNTNFKMNPPLRSEENRKATVNALLNGIACCIATDHAPHAFEDKNKEYDKAANGIIGLETAAALVYTNLVRTGLANFKDFENWMTNNARKIAGLEPNKIEVGAKANLAVLDINNKRQYIETEIKSKGKNSPFIGYELYGFNTLTIYNGKIVYETKGEI